MKPSYTITSTKTSDIYLWGKKNYNRNDRTVKKVILEKNVLLKLIGTFNLISITILRLSFKELDETKLKYIRTWMVKVILSRKKKAGNITVPIQVVIHSHHNKKHPSTNKT